MHWKDWCGSWNSNTLATWCKELIHLKIPWCWDRLKKGEEGDDRGWDGWMASLTRWTWVWARSGSWWWTGKRGVLQSMELQRVGHNWVTELTDSMDTSLSKLWEIVKDREARCAAFHEFTNIWTQLRDWTTATTILNIWKQDPSWIQVFDILWQKEFSERQSDRLVADSSSEKHTFQTEC